MAGNGKRTVVSLKKHEALKHGFSELKKQIVEYESQIKDLNELVRALESKNCLREELKWFSGQMEAALEYHDATKGDSYRELPSGCFAEKIIECIASMARIIGEGGPLEENKIMHGSVKIANFGMMMGVNAAVRAGKFKFTPIPF